MNIGSLTAIHETTNLPTLLLLFSLQTYSQTFLKSYAKYRYDKVSAISNKKSKKKIQAFINAHIIELDTVFQSYKAKTGFDFNIADTVFLIYDSPAESPFISDIIIWSGKDTISCMQGFDKHKRIITYTAFSPTMEMPKGYKAITVRGSIITLASRRDYSTIMHLGDGQDIIDGSYVHIYVAFKENGRYKIESCSPPKFLIETKYSKE